jgi:CRP/FNR family transcriptional regulator, cyclic AMP receptor protein
MSGTSVVARFQGDEGRQRLAIQLQSQVLLAGSTTLAAEVAAVAEVSELAPADVLIRQDATDNDLYFILSGRFRVLVNNRDVALRGGNDHVGEMAIIDPTSGRTATVVATQRSIVAKVTEPFFSALADKNPQIWRAMSLTLCRRLDERKKFHAKPNEKPILFIGSSREQLAIGEAVKASIPADLAHVTIWTDGVFGASSFALLDLEAQLKVSDFALLVAGADDQVTSRGTTKDAPRDNIVFELGLFMGALAHARTFMLTPAGIDMKIPSDLLGLSELRYDPNESDLGKAVHQASEKLRAAIASQGPK